VGAPSPRRAAAAEVMVTGRGSGRQDCTWINWGEIQALVVLCMSTVGHARGRQMSVFWKRSLTLLRGFEALNGASATAVTVAFSPLE
jgi:hypothetical protein